MNFGTISGRRAVVLFNTLIKWGFLLFFLAIALVPPLWLMISSFKSSAEFIADPLSLPASVRFDNWIRALEISGLPRLFLNSVIVSALSTLCTILITAMAAFVLSRIEFPGRKYILAVITVGILMPIIAFMVPYYRLVSALGLYDTLWGLILTYSGINIPISLFILHSFMKQIPDELEEAALIDGCSLWGRFWRIILPLSRSSIATVGVFIFLVSWNEFIYALLLTSSDESRTVQLGIRFFRSQFFTDYPAMFAAISMTVIPSVVVYIFFHERIISGLTSGALKS